VLRDLTMINEVPKLLDNGHINFRKLSCIYGVIKSVERFQVCKAGSNQAAPPRAVLVVDADAAVFSRICGPRAVLVVDGANES
jgi:hypothetical protein